MVIYTRYSPPRVEGLDCSGDEGYTRQEFKDECDINTVMAKYTRNKEFPLNVRVGRYGDFSTGLDYREAQDTIIAAKAQFESLPSDVRSRFQNDPASFLDFVNDSKNLREAMKLGLLTEEARERLNNEDKAAAVAAQPSPQK